MPSFTKEAILKAFLHIAAKKPIEKITVRDIVDECGVNRNTFYYYFQDIYAVLEELGRQGVGALPAELGFGEAVEMLYRKWLTVCGEHPRALRNLTISLGADGFGRYFAPVLNEVLIRGLMHDAVGASLPTELQRLAVDFARHALIGICMDTVREKGAAYDAAQLRRTAESMLTGLGYQESTGRVKAASGGGIV